MRARPPELCALLVAMASMMAWGVPPSKDAGAPAVLRFVPAAVDFGEILVGGTKSATVEVENASSAPLSISRIIPGCSCTKASDAPKAPLAPGARFTLAVSLDGGDLGGAKLKKVVNFVIEGHPTELLHLSATVPEIVSVKPEIVDSGKVPEGSPATVTLQSTRGIPFAVREVQPAGIASAGSGAATRHDVAIDMQAWRAAGTPTKLTILTDHPSAERLFVLMKVAPQHLPGSAAPGAPKPPAPPAPPK